MSDRGLNERYKVRYREAVAEHGEPLPASVIQELQESLRLEWVVFTRGEQKKAEHKDQEDGLEEAEGPQEEDPGTSDGDLDGEPGPVEGELAPADTLETRRRKPRKTQGTKAAASRTRNPRKKG